MKKSKENNRLKRRLREVEKQRDELLVLAWLLVKKMGGTATVYEQEIVTMPNPKQLKLVACPSILGTTYKAIVKEV